MDDDADVVDDDNDDDIGAPEGLADVRVVVDVRKPLILCVHQAGVYKLASKHG